MQKTLKPFLSFSSRKNFCQVNPPKISTYLESNLPLDDSKIYFMEVFVIKSASFTLFSEFSLFKLSFRDIRAFFAYKVYNVPNSDNDC